jgi:transposase
MIPRGTRIFVSTRPQDMRVSFDGLALAAKQLLGEDPQSGALFCFVGRRANRIKVLWWDRNGYCLLYKRLHRAVFRVPASDAKVVRIQIDGRELATLLAGVARERRRRESA